MEYISYKVRVVCLVKHNIRFVLPTDMWEKQIFKEYCGFGCFETCALKYGVCFGCWVCKVK